MRQVMCVLGLFFIAGAICASSADQYPEKNVRKSSLILEYNWPEPSKSLNRLPHPRSCNHFIHTKQDGSHIVKRCHGDKIFDYRSLRCQNKSSAKCWMNIVKKGNIKKVKRTFSCPFPWGLYPDKEDCSLFYDCMGGKIYPRKCPDSTLFDAVERICVHSKKALCAQDSDFNTKDRDTSEPLLLFKTIKNEKDIESEEDSYEETSRKHRTKSNNKYTGSKLSFASTSIKNPKSSKTNEHSDEENSSEEKPNRVSFIHDLKSKTSKIQNLSDSNYSKKFTPSSTEKRLIAPSSQNGDSSELPIQSTIVKSFVNSENELKLSSITIAPGDSKIDENISDNAEKKPLSFPAEKIEEKPSHLDSIKPSLAKLL